MLQRPSELMISNLVLVGALANTVMMIVYNNYYNNVSVTSSVIIINNKAKQATQQPMQLNTRNY